jgi:hypothetical protein
MRVDLRFCAYVEAAKEMVSLDEGIHWLENNPILFWIRGAGFCGNRRCIYIFFYIYITLALKIGRILSPSRDWSVPSPPK